MKRLAEALLALLSSCSFAAEVDVTQHRETGAIYSVVVETYKVRENLPSALVGARTGNERRTRALALVEGCGFGFGTITLLVAVPRETKRHEWIEDGQSVADHVAGAICAIHAESARRQHMRTF